MRVCSERWVARFPPQASSLGSHQIIKSTPSIDQSPIIWNINFLIPIKLMHPLMSCQGEVIRERHSFLILPCSFPSFAWSANSSSMAIPIFNILQTTMLLHCPRTKPLISHPLHWIQPYFFNLLPWHDQHNVPWPCKYLPPLCFSCNFPSHWQRCNWADVGFTHHDLLYVAVLTLFIGRTSAMVCNNNTGARKIQEVFKSTECSLIVVLMLLLICVVSFIFIKEILNHVFIFSLATAHMMEQGGIPQACQWIQICFLTHQNHCFGFENGQSHSIDGANLPRASGCCPKPHSVTGQISVLGTFFAPKLTMSVETLLTVQNHPENDAQRSVIGSASKMM